jgi:gliding motility-associated-like protein
MKRIYFKLLFYFSFAISILFSERLSAQCIQLRDGNNVFTGAPYWISCSGNSYDLHLVANISFTSFTVNWDDGSPTQSGGPYNAGDSISHTFSAATDTFVVSLQTNTGCQITGVVVMETPVTSVAQMSGNSVGTICSGQSISFDNQSISVSPTTKFIWDFGDGTTQSFNFNNAGQTISHTYNANNVSCNTVAILTASNYCNVNNPSTSIVSGINVYKKDQISVTADANIKCGNGATFTFTNNGTPNCINAGNTFQRKQRWNFHNYWGLGQDSITAWTNWPPSSNGIISFPTIGTYSVTLIDSSFCGRDSISKTISIINPPTAGLSPSNDSICVNIPIFISNTSSAGYTYQWNFGDNSTFTTFPFGNVSNTYTASGTYTVKVAAIVSGGDATCRDTASTQITVVPKPNSSFSLSPPNSCDGVPISFINNSTGASIYTWKLNGTTFSNAQTPASIQQSNGSYTVSLQAVNSLGCSHTSQQTFQVQPSPTASFSVTNQNCENSVVTFTDLSTSANTITSWEWDFGDNSALNTNQNPTHSYNSAGTFTASLVVKTSVCTDTIKIPVIINPAPVAAFNISTAAGCQPLSVNFTSLSVGATIFNWDLGNSSTPSTSTASTVYTNTTSSTISFSPKLVVENSFGCKDSITNSITVFATPNATFNTSTTSGCSPLNTNFTNTSGVFSAAVWNFDDGSPTVSTTNASHIFTNTGSSQSTFTVSLVISNASNCTDTARQVIQVFPLPIFNITLSDDSVCSPGIVNFNASSGATTYQWDFGDGGNDNNQNTTHTYSATSSNQSFNVQLIATTSFGCKDTLRDTVKVFITPNAAFSATPSSQTFPNSTVTLNNTTSNSSALIFNWNFGDGQNFNGAQPGTHVYSTFGTYTISLIANSGYCIDTLKQVVTILPPVPDASFTGTFTGCNPLTATFINNSQFASNYFWEFGDGNDSTTTSGGNMTHTYTTPGTYSVKLKITGPGGSDSLKLTNNIIVRPTPTANFTANPLSLIIPESEVTFTNTSVGATNYVWYFGDGDTSHAKNPKHTYEEQNDYQVTLIAANSFGCKDTFKLPNLIRVSAVGNIEVPNAFTPSTLGPSNDGYFDPSSLKNDIFHPVLTGIKTYQLRIYNRWGEMVFETTNQKVGWDGYYNGKLCQQEIYIWKINAVTQEDIEIDKAGDVLLLR